MTYEITAADISLPERKRDSHKGNYGRILLMCGCKKYTGAAFFSAQAAVNSGSGLVFLSVPDEIRPILASKLNEPIIINRKVSKVPSDAALLGCGIGISRGSLCLVRSSLAAKGCPLVLDADGITLAARIKTDLSRLNRSLILTPHEGEFQRLVPNFDRARRAEFASNFAKKNKCVLVLKGHRTITAAPSGEIYVNTSGNPGMAKGGSGDILAGIITSLIGQGIPEVRAAYTGVWLHGMAGDLAAEKYGEYGMTPTDMLCSLKSVMRQVQA